MGAPTGQGHGQTCARCGHVTLGCDRCGRNDPLLGSSIGDDQYCHTFSEGYPTCYMLTSWDRSDNRAPGEAMPGMDELRRLLRELRGPAVGP
jgi:hypothetical protein